MNKKIPLLILLFSTFFTAPPLFADTPKVVVSSKPFHSLVAGVMQGRGTPTLLVDGIYSPHNYQLKPRDAAQLQQANLVFWGGEEIEPFMERALQTIAKHATTVALSQSKGLQLLPVRKHFGEEDEAQKAEAGDHHDHDHHHHDSGIDPHFWLDPINAKALVNAAATALSHMDQEGATIYQQNGTALKARLDQLHQRLLKETATLKKRPFMVFHDSYQYFETRYQVYAAGAITLNAEYGASAKGLQRVRDRIASRQVRCVFKEPQFSAKLVQVAVEGSTARIGVLDPLGSNLIAGPELYFKLMGNLSHALRSCL